MDRLDACYFCGTAGEAPLREVSIAPRARRGDPDATVAATLCPSCEGKLQNVLGRLFDHVESRRIGGESDAADASAGPGADTSAGVEPGDDTGASADDGGGTATDEGGRTSPDEAEPPVDRIDVSGEGGEGRRGGDRQPLFDPAPDIQEVPEPAPDEDDASVGGDAPSDAAAPVDSGLSGADPAGEDAEIIADEEDGPTVRARATSSADDPLDGVSVAEYNRVLRLLQNREFPMAREAFVDLASSAYDLEAGTVEQVLDTVVEKGALAERDGDLVRPGGTDGESP